MDLARSVEPALAHVAHVGTAALGCVGGEDRQRPREEPHGAGADAGHLDARPLLSTAVDAAAARVEVRDRAAEADVAAHRDGYGRAVAKCVITAYDTTVAVARGRHPAPRGYRAAGIG